MTEGIFFMKKINKFILIAAITAIAAFMLIHTINSKSAETSAVAGDVSARQAILVDGNSGNVLFEKNADERAYPASTTKIMTALITIETLEKYGSPIAQIIKVPPEAEGVEGSSLYLKSGEEISVEDLLYGMMLVSGNDAAVALAEIIGGTQENFVKMMNTRAKELGCSGTNFTNPNGLFDENHYTTVRDMAVISQAAMSNKTFRKIVKTTSWKATSRQGDYVTFANKNKTVHQYDGGNGIKIGYTESSGRTLVASAQRGSQNMICVVMSAPDWFNDAYKLMDYGFGGKE